MSTRANIVLLELGNKIWLYHHCDGYPSYLGDLLGKYLNRVVKQTGRFATDIANELIKCDSVLGTDDDGFELTNDRHGDIEYLYSINLETRTLTVDAMEPYGTHHVQLYRYCWDDDPKEFLEWCKTRK